MLCVSVKADTEEEKNMWVQDIWDLFFSHMLQLKGEAQTYTQTQFMYIVLICNLLS